MDCMIHLFCNNVNHDSSYIEVLACIGLGSWKTLVHVDPLTVSSSHGKFTNLLSCSTLAYPPALLVGGVGFLLRFHELILKNI